MTNLWITAESIADDGTATDLDTQAVEYASYVLYKLTGERFSGVETSTDWYCSDIASRWPRSHFVFMNHNRSRVLKLRSLPAKNITAVTIGKDTVLDVNSDVSLFNDALLYRSDRLLWDFNQGVLVTYTHGVEPPIAGKVAAEALAKNIKAAIQDPGGSCQLSQRVQGALIDSYQTQGVSYSFIDPQTFLNEGRTGITVVDLFIKAVNPNGVTKTAKVYSPDIPKGLR
jgi:hypothetical protein